MADDTPPPLPFLFKPGDRVIQSHDGKLAGIVMAAGQIVQVKPPGWGHNKSKYYLPSQLIIAPPEPPK